MPKADNVESWACEECPCESCPHFARCRAQLLACRAFKSFADHGGRRWHGEARAPTAELYRKIYRPAVDAAQLAA